MGREDSMFQYSNYFSVPSLCISVAGKQGQSSQILYTKRAAQSSQASASPSSTSSASSSSLPQGSPQSRFPPSRPAPIPSSPSQSQAAVRAREFAADLFRRAQGGGGGSGKETEGQQEKRIGDGGEKEATQIPGDTGINVERRREEEGCREKKEEERRTSLLQASTSGVGHSVHQRLEQVMSPASSSSSPSSPPTPSSSQEIGPCEPGYVNYSRLHYRLQQPGAAEQNTGGAGDEREADTETYQVKSESADRHVPLLLLSVGYEDDKVQLPFTVTDLKGRNLQLVTGPHNGQVCVCPSVWI